MSTRNFRNLHFTMITSPCSHDPLQIETTSNSNTHVLALTKAHSQTRPPSNAGNQSLPRLSRYQKYLKQHTPRVKNNQLLASGSEGEPGNKRKKEHETRPKIYSANKTYVTTD